MPRSSDAADVVLIDTRRNHEVRAIDRSRGWNFQQGAMPRPKTGHVFTVLADAASGKRLREYRYADPPFGNSGVAQLAGFYLGSTTADWRDCDQ